RFWRDSSGQSRKREAAIVQLAHDLRDRVSGLHAVTNRVVSIAVVQEQDVSRPGAFDRSGHYRIRAGQISVPDPERPTDCALAERAGYCSDPRAAESVRCTKEGGC